MKTADSHLSLLGGLKAAQCEVAVFTGYQFGRFWGKNKGISGWPLLAALVVKGLKFVKLLILPKIFIQFVQGSLRELRSRYLGFKGLGYI